MTVRGRGMGVPCTTRKVTTDRGFCSTEARLKTVDSPNMHALRANAEWRMQNVEWTVRPPAVGAASAAMEGFVAASRQRSASPVYRRTLCDADGRALRMPPLGRWILHFVQDDRHRSTAHGQDAQATAKLSSANTTQPLAVAPFLRITIREHEVAAKERGEGTPPTEKQPQRSWTSQTFERREVVPSSAVMSRIVT
jgi:hypothetical protein